MSPMWRGLALAIGVVCLGAGGTPESAPPQPGPPAGERTGEPGLPPIRFGTNIGHWLSQAKLDRAEMATFFTEADVARIRAWGMDHLRLPVDYPLFTRDEARDEFSEEGLSWIDRAVTWTETAGLSLVLDMHHLPGHHFMREGTNRIWQADSPERAHAISIWKRLGARYAGRPHVILELLNEAVAPEGQDDLWHELARDLIAAIRSVNSDSWIMVGSNRWNHAGRFATLPRFDDDRIVYTFHFYEPFLFTHQRASWVDEDIHRLTAPIFYPGPIPAAALHTDSLRRRFAWMTEQPYGEEYLRARLAPVLEFRQQHDVPVYCGEFGVINLAPEDDRLRWYRDLTALFRSEAIGYANWNYKSDNFGLVSRDASTVNDALLEAIGPQPVAHMSDCGVPNAD